MSKTVTNFRIKVIFAVAVLLTAVLAIVANMPSYAQNNEEYSCHIEYAVRNYSNGTSQKMTIVNTGTRTLRINERTAVQWRQDNVEDIIDTSTLLMGAGYFEPTALAFPQRASIAPGESHGRLSVFVLHSESSVIDPDSFALGTLGCTSEQVDLTTD